MDAKGFELLMSAKILGEGGGMPMDAKGFERLMAAKILGKGSDGKIKELEGVPPLTFTANGQPLLDYRIYGNTVQTGTPTPENPIMPNGCGERTENLFDISKVDNGSTVTHSGDTISILNAGLWYDLLCFTTGAGASLDITKGIFLAAGTYTIKIGQVNRTSGTGGVNGIVIFSEDGTSIEQLVTTYNINNSEKTFTTATDGYVSLRISAGNPTIQGVMLTEGSTAPTSYIPYGHKLPLTSAGQGVDIYLGEVETTRRIKKVVFDGTESWAKNSGSIPTDYTYYLSNIGNTIGRYSLICDRLPVVSAMKSNAAGIQFYSNKSTLLVNFTSDIMDAQTSGNTVIGLKEYLAAQYANGTPVTVWYVLAEPETGIVNEPMMKIGDYADTVSMEQAGVSIPTNKGSTTLDVDTIIKPSNVYIKYRS